MEQIYKDLFLRFTSMEPQGPGEITAHNFAFGALYALARAKELGYPDTEPLSGTHERIAREIKGIAQCTAEKGRFEAKGEWLAGFYYNNALLRCSVAYEHLLRHWTSEWGKNVKNDTVIVRAQLAGFQADLIIPWWPQVSEQVNILKHKLSSSPYGPSEVLPPQALEIVEHLIKAVEWAFTHRKQRPKDSSTR